MPTTLRLPLFGRDVLFGRLYTGRFNIRLLNMVLVFEKIRRQISRMCQVDVPCSTWYQWRLPAKIHRSLPPGCAYSGQTTSCHFSIRFHLILLTGDTAIRPVRTAGCAVTTLLVSIHCYILHKEETFQHIYFFHTALKSSSVVNTGDILVGVVSVLYSRVTADLWYQE